jgi:hypothetical protein
MSAATPSSPAWAVVTLAASAVAVGAFVALHVLPTGLSPIRNAVSHYGITRYRWGYRVLTVALGVAGVGLALSLLTAFPAGGHRDLAVGWLVAFGLSRAAISWFPMDAPGAPRTSTGTVHGVLAIVAFGAIAVASFQVNQVFHQPPSIVGPLPSAVPTALIVVSWFLLVAVLGTLLTGRIPQAWRAFGLIERCIYLGAAALLVITGAALV